METIFRWLAGVLAGILAKYADPQLEASLEAFQAKVDAQEAKRKWFLAEIEASSITLSELSQVLTDNNRKEIELENAILHAKESAAAKKAELDALTYPERVRVDL